MNVAPEPCGSCPYATKTPPGVWAREEYEKLLDYSGEVSPDSIPCLHMFLCHQTHALGQETLCRGWLTVERESLAVRVLLIRKLVTVEQVFANVITPLYASGEEAARAGIAGVLHPGEAACRLMKQLERKLKLSCEDR